ncbi:MAG: NAD(P)/FAD-dependent oxidoreductase [Candidatus Pristimantibacillus sp.]
MYDVIVVGAGPAGSVLARLLALQGVKVLMLDAAHFPRRKPCGESLNPGAVAALQRVMGRESAAALTNMLRIPFSVVNGWQLNSQGIEISASFPVGSYGIGCSRELFDYWLVEEACRAGAQFEQETRVQQLLWDAGRVIGVQVRTSSNKTHDLHAAFVAGADGIRSAVARSAGISRFGPLRKAALTARLNGVAELSDKVELFMRADGVVGLAPIGDGMANMTVALQGTSIAASASKGKAAFMMEAAQEIPLLAERMKHVELQGEVLACGPFERQVRTCVINGMILVGDAAGYYDPLTGQGIYRAIRSAELAAPTLLQALQTGSEQPLSRYNRECEQQFAGGTRLQRVIEHISRNRIVWSAALHVIGSSSLLKNKLVQAVGDCPKGGKSCIPSTK